MQCHMQGPDVASKLLPMEHTLVELTAYRNTKLGELQIEVKGLAGRLTALLTEDHWSDQEDVVDETSPLLSVDADNRHLHSGLLTQPLNDSSALAPGADDGQHTPPDVNSDAPLPATHSTVLSAERQWLWQLQGSVNARVRCVMRCNTCLAVFACCRRAVSLLCASRPMHMV